MNSSHLRNTQQIQPLTEVASAEDGLGEEAGDEGAEDLADGVLEESADGSLAGEEASHGNG